MMPPEAGTTFTMKFPSRSRITKAPGFIITPLVLAALLVSVLTTNA